jgi:hypothetical protein
VDGRAAMSGTALLLLVRIRGEIVRLTNNTHQPCLSSLPFLNRSESLSSICTMRRGDRCDWKTSSSSTLTPRRTYPTSSSPKACGQSLAAFLQNALTTRISCSSTGEAAVRSSADVRRRRAEKKLNRWGTKEDPGVTHSDVYVYVVYSL